MMHFLKMVKAGRIYLFGNEKMKLNPIHGEDLAKVCVDKILARIKEVTLGGIDTLTQNELAELALKAWNRPLTISHLQDWIRRFIIWILRNFTSLKLMPQLSSF